ncbi:hypothetical protein T4B_2813 [Trichinella pseudospiralis]|uniref:Uncharacterized protein n=1 Tax=Trichinella pseudospiralis TaxID=6337 RepID=A0A0V1GAU6_TRIPS|nr:hypothetical protein T4B_2813 [Trichinella pseudospiralis]
MNLEIPNSQEFNQNGVIMTNNIKKNRNIRDLIELEVSIPNTNMNLEIPDSHEFNQNDVIMTNNIKNNRNIRDLIELE